MEHNRLIKCAWKRAQKENPHTFTHEPLILYILYVHSTVISHSVMNPHICLVVEKKISIQNQTVYPIARKNYYHTHTHTYTADMIWWLAFLHQRKGYILYYTPHTPYRILIINIHTHIEQITPEAYSRVRRTLDKYKREFYFSNIEKSYTHILLLIRISIIYYNFKKDYAKKIPINKVV